jgi:O-antigen/teichoic acid export membrane protein
MALASQALARLSDFSSAALTEMMIRGERERLRHRFRGLLQITLAFAAVGAALLAVCNQPFVQVWTQGKISWPKINDVLLGLMLFVSSFTRTSSIFICITKDLRGLRYVNFVEGIALVCSGYVLLRWFGIPGLLTASVITSALINGAYALHRCGEYFATSAANVVVDWLRRPILVLACLAPVAAMVWLCSRWLPPIAACIVNGALVGTCGILLAVRIGIDQHLIREFILRAPVPVSKVVSYVTGSRRRPETSCAASEIK